jgi:hypothetical protein
MHVLAEFLGSCSRCGREYHADHSDVVVCDCWEQCPICCQKMTPYTPDLSPSTYAQDGKRDWLILRVCNNLVGHPNHSPHFSSQQPIQIELERQTP